MALNFTQSQPNAVLMFKFNHRSKFITKLSLPFLKIIFGNSQSAVCNLGSTLFLWRHQRMT